MKIINEKEMYYPFSYDMEKVIEAKKNKEHKYFAFVYNKMQYAGFEVATNNLEEIKKFYDDPYTFKIKAVIKLDPNVTKQYYINYSKANLSRLKKELRLIATSSYKEVLKDQITSYKRFLLTEIKRQFAKEYSTKNLLKAYKDATGKNYKYETNER